MIERVIALRDGGAELEFDLPADATAEDRAATWQFPVRVFRPMQGPLQLLNAPELEARIERWLAAAHWTREVCGRWIFTWNAFRIECDPQSVLPALASFDLGWAELREGAPYQEPGALAAGVLRREGGRLVVELPIDPEVVRRQRAESDVVVAEISQRQTLTLEAALQARATERISGTMRITFETDGAGRAQRRTKVVTLTIEGTARGRETETITETLERRLLPHPAA